MDYKEFSAKIKSKYPQYADMNDEELARKMVAKFPKEYGDVTFEQVKQQPQQSNFETAVKQPFQTIVKRTGLENVPMVGTLAKGLAKTADLPAGAIGGAAYEGGRNFNRGILNFRAGNYETGAELLATVPINLAGGAFSATPAGMAFNTTVGAAQQIPVVKEAVNSVLSPAQRAFNPQTEEGQARTGLIDAAIQTSLLGKSGEIGKGIRQIPENISNSKPVELIKNKLNERQIAKNKTPENIAKSDKLTGEIIQGEKSDIPKAKQVLSDIPNIKKVKSAEDLVNVLDTRETQLATTLDNILATNKTTKKLNDLNLDSKVGEKTISHNFVYDALKQLNDYYTATNNVGGVEQINQLVTKANSDGLTPKDINDLSRLHSRELNAFNQNGELASGLKKQSAENTRIGLKETAREIFGKDNPENKKLYEDADREISNTINTKELIQNFDKKVTALKQKTEEFGWSDKAKKLAAMAFHYGTFGIPAKFLQMYTPKTGSLNYIELEKRLNGRLGELQKLTNGNLPENIVIRKMEDYIRRNGGNPNKLPSNLERSVDINNYPVNPNAVSQGSLPSGINEATKDLPPLEQTVAPVEAVKQITIRQLIQRKAMGGQLTPEQEQMLKDYQNEQAINLKGQKRGQ